MRTPLTHVIKTSGKFLAIFMMWSLFTSGCLPNRRIPKTPLRNRGAIPVIFIYEGRAKSVCLCGDFNQWSPKKDCLKRIGKTWRIRIYLKPGRYRYLFLINGKRWTVDPKAYLNEKDGYGRKNSVLIIE